MADGAARPGDSKCRSAAADGSTGRLWIWFWAGFFAVFMAAAFGVKIPNPAPNYNYDPDWRVPLWEFYHMAIPFLISAPAGVVTREGWLYFAGVCLAHLGAASGGGAVSAAVGFAVERSARDSTEDE